MDDADWSELAAAGWDALAAAQGKPSLLGCEWFRLWHAHIGGGHRAKAACVRGEGGEIRAGLPLVARRGRGLSTMYYESLGEPLAREAEDAREIGRMLGTARAGRISLANMSAGHDLYRALRAGAEESGAYVEAKAAEPEFRIELPGCEYRDFETEALSANARRQLRKVARRAERDLGLRANPLIRPEPGRYLTELREFFRIEESGWKGRARTAIASDLARRRFYEDICGELARSGRLRHSTLHLGGELVAFDFGVVEDDGCLYSFKTSYAEHVAAYAPGNLLRASILAAAYEQGLTSNSLGSGTNRTKERFATSRAPAETLVIFPAGPRGAARRHTHRAARTVRKVRSR